MESSTHTKASIPDNNLQFLPKLCIIYDNT